MRPVAADSTGNRIRSTLNVGDKIHVVMKDGSIKDLKVTELGASSLSGEVTKMPPGTVVEVAYQVIDRLEVQRASEWKTAGLVSIVVIGVIVGVGASSNWGAPTWRWGTTTSR
jgi:hypothetical protein